MADGSSLEPSSNPVPPDRHIQSDLAVQGMLRLGDDFLIEGDVIAPGGLLLGDNVTIKGDVYTDGPIEMGSDCHLEGQILTTDGSPNRHAATGAPPAEAPTNAAQAEADSDMRYATVEATLELLWDLIWCEDHRQLATSGRLTEMEPGALEDLQAGLAELLDRTYREGHGADWTNDEVVSVLFQRVAPLLLPVEVTRLQATKATVEINRPTDAIPQHGPSGWPLRAVTFLDVLVQAVLPGGRVEATGGPTTFQADADPDRTWATIHLRARPGEGTGEGTGEGQAAA